MLKQSFCLYLLQIEVLFLKFIIKIGNSLGLSRSKKDLLTIVSDKAARVFDRSGPTGAVAFVIFKAFERVWHAGLLQIQDFLSLFCYFSVKDGLEWI